MNELSLLEMCQLVGEARRLVDSPPARAVAHVALSQRPAWDTVGDALIRGETITEAVLEEVIAEDQTEAAEAVRLIVLLMVTMGDGLDGLGATSTHRRRAKKAVRPEPDATTKVVGTKKDRAKLEILRLTKAKSLKEAVQQLLKTHATLAATVIWLRQQGVDYNEQSLQTLLSGLCREYGVAVGKPGRQRPEKEGPGTGKPPGRADDDESPRGARGAGGAPPADGNWRQRFAVIAENTGNPSDAPSLKALLSRTRRSAEGNRSRFNDSLNEQARSLEIREFTPAELDNMWSEGG